MAINIPIDIISLFVESLAHILATTWEVTVDSDNFCIFWTALRIHAVSRLIVVAAEVEVQTFLPALLLHLHQMPKQPKTWTPLRKRNTTLKREHHLRNLLLALVTNCCCGEEKTPGWVSLQQFVLLTMMICLTLTLLHRCEKWVMHSGQRLGGRGPPNYGIIPKWELSPNYPAFGIILKLSLDCQTGADGRIGSLSWNLFQSIICCWLPGLSLEWK